VTPPRSRPGRFLLALLLFIPGGLLILAGILVASIGVGLCLPGLRRMTAASRGSDLPRVQPNGASPDSGPRVIPVGTYRHEHYDPPGILKSVTRGRQLRCLACGRIFAESSAHSMWCDRSAGLRVPYAACGPQGSSTGEPPTWAAPLSTEVH
jgi:hypothetical protein